MTISEKLNQEPPKELIKDHKGIQYIPIQHIERLLNDIFGWDGYRIKLIEAKNVGNELLVAVELSVYSDRHSEWITRAGLGSAPIQMTKGSTPDTWFVNKHINTLQKDAPSALSHAISNAAERLGNIFGANLKRKNGGKAYHTDSAQDPKIKDHIAKIEKTTTRPELIEVWNNIPATYREQLTPMMQEHAKSF